MEEAKNYALSDGDIKQLLGGNIKITTYPDLDKVSDIREIFDNQGRAILFFPQSSEQEGHWTALIKDGHTIEFFDPYGERPDAQKNSLSDSKLEQMRMKEPMLHDLLTNSPCNVVFNKVQLQKLQNCVNTCGRHAVCRLKHYKMPIRKYREMIYRTGENPDDFVVNETYKSLGK